jgi:MOSC domain-containing protein YiiM
MSDDNTPPGTLIRAGTAILRVSDMPNDGCIKWKARYGQAAMDWIADPAMGRLRLRGVLCSIEQDGVVTLTDRLQVLR